MPLFGQGAVPDLLQAVLVTDTRRVEALLAQGVDVNEVSSGSTALAAAVDCEQYDIAKLLLKHGADVNGRTGGNPHGQTHGWTPLFYAVRRGRADLVELLLNGGASKCLRDTRGRLPIELAREMESADMMKLLDCSPDGDKTI